MLGLEGQVTVLKKQIIRNERNYNMNYRTDNHHACCHGYIAQLTVMSDGHVQQGMLEILNCAEVVSTVTSDPERGVGEMTRI